MIIASLPAHLPEVSAAIDQSYLSGWVVAISSAAQFFLTVGILLWRMSSLIEKRFANTSQLMAQHEKEDLESFAKVNAAINLHAEEIRREFSTTSTSFRDSLAAIQAELTEKINRVELDTSRQFLSKEAIYSLVADIKDQNREDFVEIKEWLKRLEGKIDIRGT